MLPASYQLPAAALLLAGGIVSCFFGYRLFRTVLAIFGFIFGGMLASSVFGVSNTSMMVVAWLLGGLAGAFILMVAYFVGVALMGAALGAAVAHIAFSTGGRDPSVIVVILFAVAGAISATYLQRYFIIVGTAFGGAWTMIVGAMALVGNRTALRAVPSPRQRRRRARTRRSHQNSSLNPSCAVRGLSVTISFRKFAELRAPVGFPKFAWLVRLYTSRKKPAWYRPIRCTYWNRLSRIVLRSPAIPLRIAKPRESSGDRIANARSLTPFCGRSLVVPSPLTSVPTVSLIG